jgi:hypothetical protein
MHISGPDFPAHVRSTISAMTAVVAHKKNVTMISANRCLTHATFNTVLASADNSVTEWQDYIAIKCARKAKNITGSKATAA